MASVGVSLIVEHAAGVTGALAGYLVIITKRCSRDHVALGAAATTAQHYAVPKVALPWALGAASVGTMGWRDLIVERVQLIRSALRVLYAR